MILVKMKQTTLYLKRQSTLRGDTYMTSALRGGGGVTQYVTNTTDRLREYVTKGGEGV